jgi:hypothetical protein
MTNDQRRLWLFTAIVEELRATPAPSTSSDAVLNAVRATLSTTGRPRSTLEHDARATLQRLANHRWLLEGEGGWQLTDGPIPA